MSQSHDSWQAVSTSFIK